MPVTFLGFRLDGPALIGELDLLVIPSLSEGTPLVLLEGSPLAFRLSPPLSAVSLSRSVTGSRPCWCRPATTGHWRMAADASWLTGRSGPGLPPPPPIGWGKPIPRARSTP